MIRRRVTVRGSADWVRFGRRVGPLVIVALLLLARPVGAHEATPAATPVVISPTDDQMLGDVQASLRDDVIAQTDGTLSSYQIQATIDTEASTIAGHLRVDYLNSADQPLDAIYFRLYPNAPYYGDGDLAIDAVQVGGMAVEPTLEVEETALRVPLRDPVGAGSSVRIDLDFTTTVPINAAGSYGIFGREQSTGTWVLADWHPVLAVYEAARGWRIDPPTSFGDPTYAASSRYDVTLTAPAGFQLITSGTEVGTTRHRKEVAHHYEAGPAREFTMAADVDYSSVSGTIDGITVTSWAQPGAETAAQSALDVAVQALSLYNERFGAYPFGELDLVETPLSGALAVSWAGIIFMDGPSLYDHLAIDNPDVFETVVAHEVAHLWWGASVGVDSNDHTFMNEGMAVATSIAYWQWTAGDAAAAEALDREVLRLARALMDAGDAVVDVPIRDGQDQGQRSLAFYGKGSLGLQAIRNEIGDEAFFAGLQEYAETFAFRIAEPADLRAAFETASGEDLDDLWRHWFNAKEMTPEEIEAVAAGE